MRWLAIALLALVGGFMLFDGARALVVGDYLTPRTGEYAGQLGPWAGLVDSIGIEPRSTRMKVGFVAVGLIHLMAAATVVWRGDRPASWVVVAAAVSGLWYLPFGTVADTAVLMSIGFSSLRPW